MPTLSSFLSASPLPKAELLAHSLQRSNEPADISTEQHSKPAQVNEAAVNQAVAKLENLHARR